MPTKTRAARLRTDPERDLRAWRPVFRSGYDFLHALADVGVAIDGRHQPSIATAREVRRGVSRVGGSRRRGALGQPPFWRTRYRAPPAAAPRRPPLTRDGDAYAEA